MEEKINPWLMAEKVYFIGVDLADGKCSVTAFNIIERDGDVIIYDDDRGGVSSAVRTTVQQLTEWSIWGTGTTAEEAIDNYERAYIERAALSASRLQAAARSFYYDEAAAYKVKNNVEALRKEQTTDGR